LKSSSLAALALLAALAVFSWFEFKGQPQKREFKKTDEFVQWLANEAVQDARRENGLSLDCSVESIKSVEEILGTIHDQ
jgi:hypothetical protein